MTEVSGVVVAHADLAAALVEAAERISGIDGALTAISNEGLSSEALIQRVAEQSGDGPLILFTDLASGSCAFASRAVGRGRSSMAVVSGVNLPMLLDFLFNREMELVALAGRVVEKGRAGSTLLSVSDDGDRDAAGSVSD